jgi:hypothetical protein
MGLEKIFVTDEAGQEHQGASAQGKKRFDARHPPLRRIRCAS